MRIAVKFDYKRFIGESQRSWHAPRYKELREGNLGEWLLALMFIPTFGLICYPLAALCSMHLKLK